MTDPTPHVTTSTGSSELRRARPHLGAIDAMKAIANRNID
jgi:hypothetical protein